MKIIIVTPARNEEHTLPMLYQSLLKVKTAFIDWYIFENGSNDRTADVAKNFRGNGNLNIYCKRVNTSSHYNVGEKLSNLLANALEHISQSVKDDTIDYFGIFDADVFFEPSYIGILVNELNENNRLQLTSGIGLNDGEHDGEGIDHVRGNARLWKWKYIKNRGLPRGPSWDSISKFEVLLDGYEAYPVEVFYNCRKMAAKQSNYSFYGYAAYYRGVSGLFVFLKAFKMLYRNEGGLSYIYGYLSNLMYFKNKTDNEQLRKFVRDYSLRKISAWILKN